MRAFVVGAKVRFIHQPDWGVGHLLALRDEGHRALVQFPVREEATLLNTRGGALIRAVLHGGEAVCTASGQLGKVTGEGAAVRGLRCYTVALEAGGEVALLESELRTLPPAPDFLSALQTGHVADAKAFLLRRGTLYLDDERRNDALGALLASRVMVQPHQVGVVQRVLAARRPRFILADEVGLGKTIEAGMVFSALRLAGLVQRALVVAPSHLTIQWLVEMSHKFNRLFTLMDAQRYEKSLEEVPTVSPWVRFPHIITSLEFLQRTPAQRKEVAQAQAYWDFVVIDEAQHLKGAKAYEAAESLAHNSWGLLLLTATPMQLDAAEYQALLSLIEPLTAPSVEEFEARLARQEALSQAVRALLSRENAEAALQALALRFPEDEFLKTRSAPQAILEHLSETYSLSNHLLRNRRARIGGFARRVLHVHPVTLRQDELRARTSALDLLAQDGEVRGAALAGLVRRLESSPAAFHAVLKTSRAFAGMELQLPDADAKYAAFLRLLKALWAQETGAKVLVFTEAKETLEMLRLRLIHASIAVAVYHGDCELAERDRQVARFRDREGPNVLLSTEVGGEGRNFQFAHHLINYDLPWSPAVVEQRIGRLDRIGQTHAVDIHVFDVQGTFSAEVLAMLRDAVCVFGETTGGLDAVLEEVEGQLTALALAPAAARAKYFKALADKVHKARAHMRHSYDELLDVRSFDFTAVQALLRRAYKRLDFEGEREAEAEAGAGAVATLGEGLWEISRDFDERLEACIAEIASRIGILVDLDREVDAFHCAFHFGHVLNVEALPGYDISREHTLLGTFWRDTAVEREEIDYLTTGHPLVEALFGFVRDGPFGRNGARRLEVQQPIWAHGLEVLFHMTPQEAADTAPGARVPARHLSRFFETSLLHIAVSMTPEGPKEDSTLLELLKRVHGRALKGHEVSAAFPDMGSFLIPAVEFALATATRKLHAIKVQVREAIQDECRVCIQRLQRALQHQGVAAARAEGLVREEVRHYSALLAALEGTSVALDSACAFRIVGEVPQQTS